MTSVNYLDLNHLLGLRPATRASPQKTNIVQLLGFEPDTTCDPQVRTMVFAWVHTQVHSSSVAAYPGIIYALKFHSKVGSQCSWIFGHEFVIKIYEPPKAKNPWNGFTCCGKGAHAAWEYFAHHYRASQLPYGDLKMILSWCGSVLPHTTPPAQDAI